MAKKASSSFNSHFLTTSQALEYCLMVSRLKSWWPYQSPWRMFLSCILPAKFSLAITQQFFTNVYIGSNRTWKCFWQSILCIACLLFDKQANIEYRYLYIWEKPLVLVFELWISCYSLWLFGLELGFAIRNANPLLLKLWICEDEMIIGGNITVKIPTFCLIMALLNYKSSYYIITCSANYYYVYKTFIFLIWRLSMSVESWGCITISG